MIKQEDRDARLTVIDADIRVALDTLNRETTGGTPPDMATMVEAFAPLAEWEYWTRDQKRLVLSTLIPDIRVADYEIESLGLNPDLFSNESTHRGRDSSPLPA